MNIKKTMICLKDINNNIIEKMKLTSLPLREDVVIQKSIEFFDDPEPCMIHRSAVMKRLYMEIYEFLLKKYESGEYELKLCQIPSFLTEYIDFSGQPAIISVEQIK